MLGDFLDDPILSDKPDLTLSIYGEKQEFRTSRLSGMHLQIAEGHVLGQASYSDIIFAVNVPPGEEIKSFEWLLWFLFKSCSISFYLDGGAGSGSCM